MFSSIEHTLLNCMLVCTRWKLPKIQPKPGEWDSGVVATL
jgi:hypothetical protein